MKRHTNVISSKYNKEDQYRLERVHDTHGDGDNQWHKQRWLNTILAEKLNSLQF